MGQGRWIAIVAGLLVLYAVVGRLGGIIVEWLWFVSVGYQSVYLTRLTAEIVLFAIGALIFFAIFYGNGSLAMRLASRHEPPPIVIPWARTSRRVAGLQLALLTGGVLLSVLVGLGIAGSWPTILQYLHPASFGVSDPLFGQDVGFFVFALPVYELVQGWLMLSLVFALIAALAVYVVRLVVPRVAPDGQLIEGAAPNLGLLLDLGAGPRLHLAVLVALLAVGMAAGSGLDVLKLVYAPGRLVFGATYADINARWPALYLSIALALVFAVAVLATARARSLRPAGYALGAWILVGIIAGSIYPALIQRLVVQPSELDREAPYIQNNITMTNRAYALDRIAEVDFPAADAVTQEELNANQATVKNFRLWDPQPLLDTYNQIQSIRLYYDFVDVDVDRYMINGEYRQVMLSARELSPDRLPSQAQTWVNRRLQYTHGFGAAMSPVNEVTVEGLPQLFLQDVPPRGSLPLTRPEIYYGENTDDYVIVKTATQEFDYPKGNDNVYTEYQGSSGVGIGSFVSRLLFAWQLNDANLLLAGALQPDSRILFNRNISSRVQLVAPFLTLDRDPYAVVSNERIYWVQDAYTTSDRYPYSQPVGLQRGSLNYLRNSVKVVTDAFDGSMHFYLAEPSDPLIRSYSAVFPGLFEPLDQMPADLRQHVRYPEDLFSIQADLYRTYHMKDVRVFYNKEDLWNVARRLADSQAAAIAPYYVIMRLPGESKEEFALILPYTPPNKNNMITWLTARSDGAAYGTLIAYQYPKEKLIYGPMQIDARIDQDPIISSQLTLWNQSGSRVIRGDLLVVPIGKSNIYVEPIYLQAENNKLPEMKRVVLATGNKIVMEPTVAAAINSLYGAQPATPAQPPAGQQAPTTAQPPQQLRPEAQALLDRLNSLEQEITSLRDDLRKYLQQSQP
ncbi:MAG: UPF0182 family protein [Chloroflexi bacterium]|nr:UPF0182 family protein [Chloroflexota bacterium]